MPLATKSIAIDSHCTGERWASKDNAELAAIVAIVAMGQAAHAAHILSELSPASPSFANSALRDEAIIRLTVQEEKQEPRVGYPRWQRDGFIFEVISWVAARLMHGDRALLLDPHVSATSQGIDGLMLHLSTSRERVERVTILEDKCTERPRKTFLEQVIPVFLGHHRGERAAEVIAAASVLLRIEGIDLGRSAELAASVTDIDRRAYRAAFALTEEHDSDTARQSLFKDFDKLDALTKNQRIGASLIVGGELRQWFDEIAGQAIAFLKDLDVEEG